MLPNIFTWIFKTGSEEMHPKKFFGETLFITGLNSLLCKEANHVITLVKKKFNVIVITLIRNVVVSPVVVVVDRLKKIASFARMKVLFHLYKIMCDVSQKIR